MIVDDRRLPFAHFLLLVQQIFVFAIGFHEIVQLKKWTKIKISRNIDYQFRTPEDELLLLEFCWISVQNRGSLSILR